MALSIPAELKRITQFVRRAEELDGDRSRAESRLVAYYCRQFAVQAGIPLATTDAGRTCLGEILNKLEEEKEPMSAFTKQEACIVCTKFANNVFDNADGIDRNGKASKSTAKSFYAAAVFLEILEQFEDPEAEEHKQKRLYAKWKATEILKAIKEGRDIVPGGYGEQVETEAANINGNETEDSVPTASLHREDLNEDEGTEVEINGTISPPSYNETQDEQNDLPPPISAIPLPPPPTIAPVAAPTEAPKTMANLWGFTTSSKNVKLSKEHFEDAKELTKFALAALEAKDSELAANRLKQALQAIGY